MAGEQGATPWAQDPKHCFSPLAVLPADGLSLFVCELAVPLPPLRDSIAPYLRSNNVRPELELGRGGLGGGEDVESGGGGRDGTQTRQLMCLPFS